jgi:excisionase family DNA binding protein
MVSTKEIPKLFSVPETAGILGVSDQMVYKLTRGNLPYVRVGGRKFILAEDLSEYLKSRRISPRRAGERMN